jgi:hypothetical protein
VTSRELSRALLRGQLQRAVARDQSDTYGGKQDMI